MAIFKRANIAKIAWAFEVFITSYLERVMNNVIFQVEVYQIYFLNLDLIVFGGVRNSTHFCTLLHLTFCENGKNLEIMTSFRTLISFFQF
jgi:hypothetical protein